MRAARATVKTLLMLIGIGVLVGAAVGLKPVFPALAAGLRALLHPFVLIAVAVLVVLMRARRPVGPDSKSRSLDDRRS